jgi:UDP-N-acetylglucosamine 2-epimerase (non-hydrolysing)/GDP/UDP-N,N'-diacetylbacillosamine 2-epimerase (hydrolysing)
MSEIDARAGLELLVIATGSHLSEAFGATAEAIEADGFAIAERVEILDDDDSARGTVRAMARAVSGIGDALDRLSPDLVVLLGDRYEILAAAQAALVLGIPVAHIAGGELTEGAFDDAIRHAVTKMSHLHFPYASEYRDRIIQLGEDPARVVDVGATGLDNFERLPLLDRPALAAELGVEWDDRPLIAVTFHPETLARQSAAEALAPLFEVLAADESLQVVITKANADTGGREINAAIDAFTAEHPERVSAFSSLGQLRYLSLLRAADVVLGNSSSGIIEAPTAGTPTVNIGARQQGRLRAPSIIDVENTAAAIRDGLDRALAPAFQASAAEGRSPYGTPGAGKRIVDLLESADLDAVRIKRFHAVVTSPGGSEHD